MGPFTSTVTFSNPLLTWTNKSAAATVDRTQGLPFTWTGGSPGTYVILSGSSAASGVTVGYSCRIAAEAGQFTLPFYILLGIPAGSGGTVIQHQVVSTFSAAGVGTAGVTAVIEYTVPSTYR